MYTWGVMQRVPHLTQRQKPKRKYDPSKYIPDVFGRREESEIVILSDTKSPGKVKTVKAMQNWPWSKLT